jgi:hypothetical protein
MNEFERMKLKLDKCGELAERISNLVEKDGYSFSEFSLTVAMLHRSCERSAPGGHKLSLNLVDMVADIAEKRGGKA